MSKKSERKRQKESKTPAQPQLGLRYHTWGGARRGAGRPRQKGRRNVPHVTRPKLASRYPVHVTLRVLGGLPNLRQPKAIRTIERCFFAACNRLGMRLVHYSVQRDHIHLIVEAKGSAYLSRGVQGLNIRIAKRLNALWGRRGSVFADRYHARILRTPSEVRHCLNYVLNNSNRHLAQRGFRHEEVWFDPCSSAKVFDGWQRWSSPAVWKQPDGGSRRPKLNRLEGTLQRAGPVVAAQTWLLNTGWRRLGLLNPSHVPG